MPGLVDVTTVSLEEITERINQLPDKQLDPAPGSSVLKNVDRLSGKLLLHYEQHGEKPHTVDLPLTVMIDPKSPEPYPRRLHLDETWTDFDLGWHVGKKPGMVVLYNKEKEKTIWVHMGDESNKMEVGPRLWNVYSFGDATKMKYRSSNGPLEADIVVLSR